MNFSIIALFDFVSAAGTAGSLKAQLCGTELPGATVLHQALGDEDMSVATHAMASGIARLRPHIVILALSKNAHAAAGRVFDALLALPSPPPIVAVPCSEETETIAELLRLGASDYLLPPFRPADVRPRIQRLLAFRCAELTPVSTLREALSLDEFVGDSAALRTQTLKLPRMARSDACVLITGETGTGKELCARAVHYLSCRARRPFVPLNCGAIPGDLLENELFGHAAGAFTSANASQVGVLQEANGGSLFLDEIDALPPSAQVKLLRFLQDKQYRPLGTGKPRKADVRVIAASNQNLEQLMKESRFRSDLFYRLNVLSLQLPPLRLRKEDIPALALHFLARQAAASKAVARQIAPAALRKLSLYDWPGNVRELENVIERAAVLSTEQCIQSDDIDVPICPAPPAEIGSFGQLKAKLVAEFEQNYLRDLLERCHGNIAQAARLAQKNRRVFFQLMRKHHIRIERSSMSGPGGALAKGVIIMDNNVHPLGSIGTSPASQPCPLPRAG